ncbi:uncharacterized protein LOC110933956 [Helianthus annuus]|uniref:uncharacterized protein LOC110933956 n=1 Tax=Helianthus annuus TaxID=4232 RepID=UPI000B9068CE|nr:uncharacterized protein LOC110933956 [Helianthus annuus]
MALVPVKEGSSMTYQYPVLTATNYPVWAVKVKPIMDAHGFWETLHRSQASVGRTEDTVFGVDRVRAARLATLRMELESSRMKEGETVDEFMVKLSGLAAKVRSLGYELEEVDLVKRLLDSMPKPFFQIVASIEQCFELESMLFDEVVGRLKAYVERLRATEKTEDIQGGLLLGSHEKPHGCKHCGVGSSSRDDFGHGRGRGCGSGRGRDGNERFRDKSHVKHDKCGEYGHYNNECQKLKNEEANLIEEEPTSL